MMNLSLVGLIGAVIGTIIAAVVYVPLVTFVERGLRSRADGAAEGETLEQEISLLRRAVLVADIIVFAGIRLLAWRYARGLTVPRRKPAPKRIAL